MASREEAHQLIWEEVQKTGQVPPAAWMARRLDSDPGLVRRWYGQLVEAGVMDQPHERTSYRLRQTPEGLAVVIEVRVEEGSA